MTQANSSQNDFDSLLAETDLLIEDSAPPPIGTDTGGDFSIESLLNSTETISRKTGMTPAGEATVDLIKREIGIIPTPDPDVPIEAEPDKDRFFISDIGRASLRTIFNMIGSVAGAPEALAETTTGDPPAWVQGAINNVTKPISEFANNIAQSDALAPDLASRPTLPGFQGVIESIMNPNWWSNKVPELVTNAGIFILAGAGTKGVARRVGISPRRAAQFGKGVAITMAGLAETGGSFQDLLHQMDGLDIPDQDKRDIASRGAVAVGLAATLLEMGVINYNLRGANTRRFMRVIRDVAAESTQEEAQLFAQAGIYLLIEHEAQIELDNGISAMSIFETGVGGGVGALTGNISRRSFSDMTTEQVQELVTELEEKTGQPEETVEKNIRDAVEASPTEELKPDPIPQDAPPAVEPSAPTGQAQPAPAEPAAGEAVQKPVEPAVTPTKPETGKLPQAAVEGEGVAVEPVADLQQLQAIQIAELEALRRQKAKESRVDDLNQTVAANLPDILTKQQIKSFTNKINNATSPKRLRVVIRQIRNQVQKTRTKQAQDRLVKSIKDFDIQKIDPDEVGDVRDRINAIDTKPLSDKQVEVFEQFRDIINRKGEQAVPKSIRDAVARLDLRPVNNMSEGEANELADLLTTMATKARNDKKNRDHLNRADIRGSAKNISSEIDRAADTKTRKFINRLKDRAGPITKIAEIMVGKNFNLPLEFFLEAISGSDQTATKQALFDTINDADTKMKRRFIRLFEQMQDTVKVLGLEDEISDWFRPDWNYESGTRKVGFTRQALEGVGLARPPKPPEVIQFDEGGEVESVDIFKGERLAILMQLQDTSTFDLLMHDSVPVKLPGMKEGESVTLRPQDYRAIIESATLEERQLADALVKIINDKKQVSDFARSVFNRTGTNPVREGTYVRRRRARDLEPTTFDARFFTQKAIGSSGITKERNPRDKSNSIVIGNGIADFIGWATQHSAVVEMAEPMERTVATAMNPRVKSSIVNNHKSATHTRLMSFYNQIMRETVGGVSSDELVGKQVRRIFNDLTKGSLGFRPWIAAYQNASLGMASTVLDPKYLPAAILHRNNEQLDDEITENSPKMWFRKNASAIRILDNSIRQDEQMLEVFKSNKIGETLSMGLVRNQDWKAIRAIWAWSKMQATAEGHTGRTLMERTRQLHEKTVRETQPDWDTLGMVGMAIDARNHIGSRFLNFFRSARSKVVATTYMNVMRYARSQISRKTLMRNLLMGNVAQALFISSVKLVTRNIGRAIIGGGAFLLTGDFGDDDEDITVKGEMANLLADTISANTTSFMFAGPADAFIRSILGGVLDEDIKAFDAQLSPVGSMFTRSSRQLSSMGSAISNEREDAAFRNIKNGVRVIEAYLTVRGFPVAWPIESAIKLAEEVASRTRKGSTSEVKEVRQ